jgi:anti-anti-sigma regulatory factor
MHRAKEKPRGVRIVAFARILPDRGDDRPEQNAREALAKSEETVIVEMSQVVFLDLPQLVTLLRFIADVRARDGEVGLASLSGPVRLQAQKMHLHRFVEIFNTTDEALRSLTRPATLQRPCSQDTTRETHQ